jgi:hypothetical protein
VYGPPSAACHLPRARKPIGLTSAGARSAMSARGNNDMNRGIVSASSTRRPPRLGDVRRHRLLRCPRSPLALLAFYKPRRPMTVPASPSRRAWIRCRHRCSSAGARQSAGRPIIRVNVSGIGVQDRRGRISVGCVALRRWRLVDIRRRPDPDALGMRRPHRLDSRKQSARQGKHAAQSHA